MTQDHQESIRVQITGGPGSGKTTVARQLGAALGLPVYETDQLWLDLLAEHQPEPNISHGRGLMAEMLTAIAREDRWIVDGASVGDAAAIMDGAQIIVRMETPFRIAGYRILSRHLRAELARNNRWPGWQQLGSFWNWSRRWYACTNEPGLNDYGTPRTQATLLEDLSPYKAKVINCRTYSEVEQRVRRGGDSVAA